MNGEVGWIWEKIKAGKTMIRLYCIKTIYFPFKKIKQIPYMDI